VFSSFQDRTVRGTTFKNDEWTKARAPRRRYALERKKGSQKTEEGKKNREAFSGSRSSSKGETEVTEEGMQKGEAPGEGFNWGLPSTKLFAAPKKGKTGRSRKMNLFR